MFDNINENTPELWRNKLVIKQGGANKYNYGYALIYGAPQLTGASCLAASAAAKVGVGLVTLVCKKEVQATYQVRLPYHIMVQADLDWEDNRVSARLYGPGGMSCAINHQADIPTILDADAINADNLRGTYPKLITPHEGEFKRTFPNIEGSAIERATQAAKQTHAIVVLKGQETIIANTDMSYVVNRHASPWLATAGSGDVLAGVITGLVAQGIEPFIAAKIAVWVHGECSIKAGPYMVATDLLSWIPTVMRGLLA